VTSALDARRPDPLWVQAVATLREQVAEGALPQGSRLPSERDLCRDLGISRVTLRKALQQLVEEGMLRPSHGRGWYVGADERAEDRNEWPNSLESFTETAARMGLVPTSLVLRAEPAPATFDEAEQLGVAPGSALFHLDRVRMLDEVPIALDASLVPADLVPGLADVDFRVRSLYITLTAAGLEPAHAETTIEAREADPVLAARLDVEPGRPLLVMHQTVRSAGDRPLLRSSISYVGDRYRLRTSFVRSTG
jgi:GntR family transcriptional regulator